MSKETLRLAKNVSRKYILNDKTQFVISEAYKTARTNLIFSLARSDNKVIVVTSCTPAEGKSTNCVNMAITLSQMEEKVLIIDGDLRKPTIHSLLNVKNKYGLSSILGGFCDDIKEAINKNVRPNLDVITSGPIPPNPAELLGSQYMTKMLDVLKKYYDYILIDTPPVNVVSDSQILNPVTAGMIFVVRAEHTSHTALRDALQSVELANGKVLGFLKVACNPKATKSMRGYNKNYSYKYGGYTYGYGNKPARSSSTAVDEDGDKPILQKEELPETAEGKTETEKKATKKK